VEEQENNGISQNSRSSVRDTKEKTQKNKQIGGVMKVTSVTSSEKICKFSENLRI
jgi:hypothetical protein